MDTRLDIASRLMGALLGRQGGVLGTDIEIEPARLAELAELAILGADYLMHMHQTIAVPPALDLGAESPPPSDVVAEEAGS